MHKNNRIKYKADINIIQAFVDLQEMFEITQTSEIDYPSVKAWLRQILHSGPTNIMIQEVLTYIYKLSREDKKEEAALLLLVSAATKNDDSNHMLARELFKGDLFVKNDSAAFGILNGLMLNNHKEAICDLAFFYSNGIAVKRSQAQATKLYGYAMDSGVERARAKYESLTKSQSSFLDKLKGGFL